MSGRLIGLGLGPGDPDLMSVRARRWLTEADRIAYFHKSGRKGHARTLVEGLLKENMPEYAMTYPVTTELSVKDPQYNALLAEFYTQCSQHIHDWVTAGDTVAVLCEGDPFFYGSFMHLYRRLHDQLPTDVVPGITGMSAAWTATGIPMTWGDDVMTVLIATLPEATLQDHMQRADALVIMKIGRHGDKLRTALANTGRLQDAWLVTYASMTEQQCLPFASAELPLPYFSIVVVHGQGRRP